jgi:hypothetical protein
MTVHVTRQPNIGNGLDDQTNIKLTLFNTILETTNTHAKLEHSWEVIERTYIFLNVVKTSKGNLEINNSLSSYP